MEKNIRFNIKRFNASDSLQHIYNLTIGLTGINTNYIDKMTEQINQRKHSWFGYIESPNDISIIKQIIGKKGHYLKFLTTKYKVDIVWHERVENKFIVWGSKLQMIKTLHALRNKIISFDFIPGNEKDPVYESDNVYESDHVYESDPVKNIEYDLSKLIIINDNNVIYDKIEYINTIDEGVIVDEGNTIDEVNTIDEDVSIDEVNTIDEANTTNKNSLCSIS